MIKYNKGVYDRSLLVDYFSDLKFHEKVITDD